jgi:hypothetical protein
MNVDRSDELAGWSVLYDSIVLQLRKLDEDGCPIVRAMGEADPKTYPKYMLAALSRSYVMARWMMLDTANKAADLDKLRVYDRFISDPEISNRLIDPTIMTLRRAGCDETAKIISTEHFARYDVISNIFPDDMRGKLDWSETNMEMIQVVFVTGSDENRKQITADPHAVLSMIRERGINRVAELFHIMNGADGGSVALSAGAL